MNVVPTLLLSYKSALALLYCFSRLIFEFLYYLEIREKKTSFPPHLIIFCFRSFVSYLGEE